MNNQMEEIKVVGSVFFDDELSSIGISVNNKRATTFIRESEVKELEAKNKQQEKLLIEACEALDESASRSIYTFSNTSCESCKDRVIKVAKLCQSILDKPEIKELLERNEKDEK